MNFITSVLNGLLIFFFPIAHLLAGHPDGGWIIGNLAAAIFGLFFLALAILAAGWLDVFRGFAKPPASTGPAILIDGSNVMHWGGDPSLIVIKGMLQDLQTRGFNPLIYFDANVGFKLYDAYANSQSMALRLGLPRWQVEVVPGGVIADERLLERASRGGLKIVTNDRFRDWQARFPRIGEHGFLIKGKWSDKGVIWRFPQDLEIFQSA